MTRIQRVFLAWFVVLALVGIIFGTSQVTQTTYGQISISITPPDTQDLSIKINGTSVTELEASYLYKVKTGSTTLHVAKSGYKDFTRTFVVTKDQQLNINVVLEPKNPQTQSQTNQVLQATLLGTSVNNMQVTGQTYFYNNSWAVANVKANDGNSAYLVLAFNQESGAWETKLGPGTIFMSDQLTDIPSDVTGYMYDNNLVIGDNQP